MQEYMFSDNDTFLHVQLLQFTLFCHFSLCPRLPMLCKRFTGAH